MGLLDICVIIICVLLGFNLKNFFDVFSRGEKRWLNYLFGYHLIISIVFSSYIAVNGGDATHYWETAKIVSVSELLEAISRGSASAVVMLINYIPSNILELSFFTGNMLYCILGYLALLFYVCILKSFLGNLSEYKQLTFFRIPIVFGILFLPNIHFWSSGVGKDTLVFFAISLFIYSLLRIRKRFIGIVISIILSISIRPHITLFLLGAFGVAYLLDGKLKAYQKILFVLVFLVGFLSIFGRVMQFVQLESLEVSEIEQYAANKSSQLNSARSGSGIDTSSYPFPLKVFTFLYRPLFFDIGGVFGILASVENVLLLMFTVVSVRKRFFVGFKRAQPVIKGLAIFTLSGILTFPLILGNLGIMMRQKNMFMPSMLIFFIWLYYLEYENKKEPKLTS